MSTEETNALGPLVPLAVAANRLGIGRTCLAGRMDRGEVPVVYTARRKRWVPLRAIEPRPWTGGSLTRRELAELLGVSYGTIVRAVTRNYIPVLPDGKIPELWLAEMCDLDAYERSQQITFV